MTEIRLQQIDAYRYRIPRDEIAGMRTASAALIEQIRRDQSLVQAMNVATLPGIVGSSLAMPDIHQGYGFPIGGVAAIDVERGAVSPGGVGFDISCGVRLVRTTLDQVLRRGARWMVENGYGDGRDAELTEAGGALEGALPDKVSDRAKERGIPQLGTLGGGNHFLEVQYVEEVHDVSAARAMGIQKGQVVVLIHSGSRGLGHQVCTDYVALMNQPR